MKYKITILILLILFGGYIAFDKLYYEKELNKEETKNTEIDDTNIEKDDTYKSTSNISNNDILEFYKDVVATYNDNATYALSDLNDDGVIDLLVYTEVITDNIIIAETNIYSYDEKLGSKNNHYIITMGTINGRYANWYKMDNGTLMLVNGHMGAETVSIFKIENAWLVRTSYSYNLDVTNYTSGDELIEFISCNDYSLFELMKS